MGAKSYAPDLSAVTQTRFEDDGSSGKDKHLHTPLSSAITQLSMETLRTSCIADSALVRGPFAPSQILQLMATPSYLDSTHDFLVAPPQSLYLI